MLETTFNFDNIIQLMAWLIAPKVKKTVFILDNCPIHKSKKYKTKIDEWKENVPLIY